MSLAMAFGITETDIETVLRQNSLRIANSDGRSFSEMAESIHDDWCGGPEFDRIASAALDGGTDMDDQTDAAHSEIKAILIEDGVLKP